MTGALVVASGRDGQAPVTLTAVGARRLTDQIRRHLGAAITGFAAARDGQAHLALGYPTWHDYAEAEFGDLRELRLPAVERRALVQSMREADLSVRAIAGRLGVGVGTVHADLPSTRTQLRAVPDEPPVVDHLPKVEQVRLLVARQGGRGLTCLELEHETGWRHGVASGPYSRAARRGLIVPTGTYRAGYAVHICA